jgi:YD repeat-containing protein
MTARDLGAKSGLGAALIAVFGLLTMTAAWADVIFTYDAVGRVRTARYDNGICVFYVYDANGNRTAQTNVNGGAPGMPTWGSGVWGCFPWTP